MYPLELVGLVMSSVTTAPQGRQRKNEVKRYHMAGTWRGPTTYCLQLRSRTWRLLKMRPRWDLCLLLPKYFKCSHILPVIRMQLCRMPGKWVCMLPETSSPTIKKSNLTNITYPYRQQLFNSFSRLYLLVTTIVNIQLQWMFFHFDLNQVAQWQMHPNCLSVKPELHFHLPDWKAKNDPFEQGHKTEEYKLESEIKVY